MSQDKPIPQNTFANQGVTICSNCRSAMPGELRFCRNCGFRLGGGPAEYVETARFNSDFGTDYRPPSSMPSATFQGQASNHKAAERTRGRRSRRRLRGISWIVLLLFAFSIPGAVITTLVSIHRQIGGELTAAEDRSYFGVNSFDSTEGGVTFDNVEPPGSPADLAGLVGGDVITAFDNRPVNSEDEIRDVLRSTPVGKTVDVVFTRDGQSKTTKLTTISKKQLDRLTAVYRDRPQGMGHFGYDDDEAERVQIPDTGLFGVKLNQILRSRPADIAGIKEGDIVVEFGGVPIRTPEELLARIRRTEPYTTIPVVVFRGTERLEIPVRMGRQ